MNKGEFSATGDKMEYYLPRQCLFPFKSIPKGSKILLYGAGWVGQMYYEQIKDTGYAEIVQWADKNMDKYSYLAEKIENKNILIKPKDINPNIFDYAVIAIDSSIAAATVSKILNEKSVSEEKIIWYDKAPQHSRDEMYRLRILNPAISRIKMIDERRKDNVGGGGI